MKRMRRAFVVLIGCLCLSPAFSQIGLRIRLDSASVIPATADTGTSFNFNYWIINDSNTAFQGNVSIDYAVDSLPHGGSNLNSGLEFDTSSITIPARDSLIRQMTVHVTGPVFMSGPSVVVIWPVATGAYAADSLTFIFTVTHPFNAIQEPEDKRLKIFVARNTLCIEKDPEILLRRVRIYDVIGRAISDQSNPADKIPLPAMNPGIYMAEVNYNNNQRKIFRFYK